jgi:hypothetical protein
MSRKHGHRYGAAHKRVRAHFLLRMEAGETFNCWRCRQLIDPRSKWDLGHVDGGGRLPEHVHCNRATMTHAKGGPAGPPARAAHDCREVFDPRRCPECRRRDPDPGNASDRWSRHWFGDEYNPRCPDCRKSSEACDAVLRWAAEAKVKA